jgi:hypothetical protein
MDMVESIELLGHGSFQFRRVEGFVDRGQLLFGLGIDSVRLQESLVGSLGHIVPPLHPPPDPFLGHQFDHRLSLQDPVGKEVLVQPQLVLVEVVHDLELLRGLVTEVAEDLPDVGPVLLFHPGIVILLVGPGAGEADMLFLAIAPHQVVDHSAIVVGVDLVQGEGETVLYLVQGGVDARLPAGSRGMGSAQDSLSLPPARGDVRGREGMDELPSSRGSTVGHQIQLHIPGLLPIPFCGEFDWDLLVKQGLGMGVPVLFEPQDFALMGQLSVDGAGRDLPELGRCLVTTLHFLSLRDPVGKPAEPFQLTDQKGLEPLPTGVVKDLPDLGQHGFHLSVIDDLSPSAILLPAVQVASGPQFVLTGSRGTDEVLAVKSCSFLGLIQETALPFLRDWQVLLSHCLSLQDPVGEVLIPRNHVHTPILAPFRLLFILHNHCPFGYILRCTIRALDIV